MIDLFSRRTQQVEEAAKALGITDADAKATLGAKTRCGKDHSLSLNELNRLWMSYLPCAHNAKLYEVKFQAAAKYAKRVGQSPLSC